MKKALYILALAVVLLTGCKKESWIDWRIQNQLWIENIAKQPNVITTPTGLRYKVIYKGDTTQMRPDDIKSVGVTYKGSLITGKVFDSAENSTLAVSDVVSGFAEGLKKMYPTAHYILYIPYDLAYGADGKGTEGYSSFIPPYSTLIFDITLEHVY